MITNKKILVLGMARSGVAIAKLLANYDNEITITDLKEQEKEDVQELEDLGVKVIITDKQEELVSDNFDLMIKNPAIPKNNSAVVKAKELGIEVINEMEASYSFLPKDVFIIGVTGSNGKTTTTTIIYELLKYSKKRIHLGGNIGVPLASFVEKVQSEDILVLEISDHQLIDMYNFKTDISVLTNLSEVHLDFHGSYEQYKNTKRKIFNNHTNSSIAILNSEDNDILNLTNNISSKKIYFSSKKQADIYLKNDKIIYQNEEIIDTKDICLKGIHNYENIMAAIVIAKMFEVTNEDIFEFLNRFRGVEHRLEYVKTLHKRVFYNDSKATNNKSTIIALDSFKKPTILLMGGLDRNIPFDEISSHLTNTKLIVCFGETKEKIKEFAIKNNLEVIVTDTLKEATEVAYQKSLEDDIILLSPACASWDQYPDFETRGKEFKKIVNHLE